ncbi:hypothetical protein ACFE04_020808 [Oxalis oulophora]
MAATQSQSQSLAAAPDHRSSSEAQPAIPDNMKEHGADAGTIGHPRHAAGQLGILSSGGGGDQGLYSPSIYSPQPQAYYYRGFENAGGEWDEYPTYINTEGLEIGPPGVYNENPSLVYHTGYGYNPQMPYGPYSPVTTPIPSPGGEAHLYSPQQFPFSGTPYYQQLVDPNMPMPYMPPPSPVSQQEFHSFVNMDQQRDSGLFGPRPGYPPSPLGSFGRGNFPGNHGFHDSHPGGFNNGLRSGGLWSDWTKPSDRQRPLAPISPGIPPQPYNMIGSIGPNPAMASQHQRSSYGFGSGSNSYSRGHLHNDFNQTGSFGGSSISNIGMNGRGWFSADISKRRGRGSGPLCGCNGTLDILSEQNRGPRALKPKSQVSSEHGSVDNSKHIKSTAKSVDSLYNSPNFVTEYKDAKFFIIKSYSEDNVHKSIKYGVWASTPNGNKKLDAAFCEAKEKQDGCPVFLFFSVNASAQFCGVAEMLGAVDFDKNVDYWQQDKWNGQFSVKWHIVKDVPNSQFRHILLENNDNKPVTNSRDTQEVKLEQGIEMLEIFKNYETDTSILDDFDFYEDRQKAMEERKARQHQTSQTAVGVVGENEHRTPVVFTLDFMKKMTEDFTQVVKLDESNKEGSVRSDIAKGKDEETLVSPALSGLE